LKNPEAFRVIAMPSQNIDIEKTDGGKIRQYGSIARRTRFTVLKGLAVHPSGHRMIVSRQHTAQSRQAGYVSLPDVLVS